MDAGGISVAGVGKSFGSVEALKDVSLEVEEGSVFGLLGPNGAGKTTLVRVLTTLLVPDSGRASVAGFDVATQARALRAEIGLAGQYATVDENLTGRENLEMVGKLYHLPRKEVSNRAGEILQRFGLKEAADRPIKGYSGGMRRKLDLGASLVGRPKVLFLDEPTTGLDPASRNGLWETIEDLADGGTTILLTTQYLEEADRLADEIAVIDRGGVIARGTSEELKSSYGGERLEVKLDRKEDAEETVRALASFGDGEPQIEENGAMVALSVRKESGLIAKVVHTLDAVGIDTDDLSINRPTLDDVFLALTGRAAEGGNDEAAEEANEAVDAQEPARA
jgi:ABC-2 type transport system ATP-binding protein